MMAICTVLFEKLKIKRPQEAKHNQFLFQNVQNNEIYQIFKMFETTVNVYYTKSKRL